MTSLKTSSLENIKFKNSMKSHITDANIVAWVVDKVQQIENVEALKYNGELVLYICSSLVKVVTSTSNASMFLTTLPAMPGYVIVSVGIITGTGASGHILRNLP